jgi:hypothetical protein
MAVAAAVVVAMAVAVVVAEAGEVLGDCFCCDTFPTVLISDNLPFSLSFY